MILEWFQDIVIALGGFTAGVLILLRFFKSRAEKWIDSAIELRCNKSLAEYEAALDKKKLYSEEKIKKELEIYGVVINSYEKIWSSFWVCMEIIENNIFQNNQTLSTLALSNEFMNEIVLINNQCIDLVKKEASFSVYISTELYENIRMSVKKMKEWYDFLERNVRKYDINESERRKLLDLSSEVKDRIFENLRDIKEQIDLRTI